MSSLPVPALANQDIDSTLRENRVFPPPPEFSAKAHIKSLEEYEALYKQSIDDPESFLGRGGRGAALVQAVGQGAGVESALGQVVCGRQAESELQLRGPPRAGCARGTRPRIIWEGEPGEIRRLTYAELHVEVQKFANALKALGIKKGDRVAVYMGMTPELAIALLACARIGAVHSVIFGGFAANAIADRVNDSECVAILTQDSSYRRGDEIQLKRTVDEAMNACHTVQHVVVYRRTGSPVRWWRAATLVARPDGRSGAANAPPRSWIQRIRSTFFTPRGRRENRRGWCTRRAAMRCRPT